MASFKISGVVEKVFDEEQITASFKKRELVLRVEDGIYTEYVKFQAVQDRCSLLDQVGEGQVVTFSFNLKGKPYERDGKTTYFNNLDIWKIEDGDGQDQPKPQEKPQENEMPF